MSRATSDTSGVAATALAGERPPSQRLWLLIAAVTLAGLALVALGVWDSDGVDWRAVMFLAVLAIAAERLDLDLYVDSRVSVAFVPIFASVVLAGFSGPALVVPLAILASSVGTQRPPLYKTAFNFGALMIAAATSVLILRSLGSASQPGAWPVVIGPALLAAAANHVVNSGLIVAAISLSSDARFISVWRERFLWLWPHDLVLGVLGLAIATAYTAMGLWGLAVFLVPPAMMQLSIKQYLDRTTKGVLELRQAHDQLKEAHAQVTNAMGSLQRAYDGTLRALVAALDARDSETGGHSERVAELSMAIAADMGVDRKSAEWRHMQWGALLHDVGKIAVPDEILRKPAKLSEHEWETMRAHSSAGYQIVRGVEFLEETAEIVYAHHERVDGAGYPRGLRGEEIPLGSRIFAVADAFDAMTSDRPYRSALPSEEALAELIRNSGSQFDPAVVNAFIGVYQKRFLQRRGSGRSEGGLDPALKKAILEAAGLGDPQ